LKRSNLNIDAAIALYNQERQDEGCGDSLDGVLNNSLKQLALTIFLVCWMTAYDGVNDRTDQLKIAVVNEDGEFGNGLIEQRSAEQLLQIVWQLFACHLCGGWAVQPSNHLRTPCLSFGFMDS
jgi:hypothetical protein